MWAVYKGFFIGKVNFSSGRNLTCDAVLKERLYHQHFSSKFLEIFRIAVEWKNRDDCLWLYVCKTIVTWNLCCRKVALSLGAMMRFFHALFMHFFKQWNFVSWKYLSRRWLPFPYNRVTFLLFNVHDLALLLLINSVFWLAS